MVDYYSNSIEKEYCSRTDVKYRRPLGQFFTPYIIATSMAQWILSNEKDELNILDPAAGLGVFERAFVADTRYKKLRFDLWEIDKKVSSELAKICSVLGLKANIISDNFLIGPWDKKYDGIIANPPYYKHHLLKDRDKICADICRRTGFSFSIQTNVYCWFLVKSMNLLSTNGKLAFIIPSEFLNANYGERVKAYLMRSGLSIHIISIDFKENVFENALTTSSIILAEKNCRESVSIDLYSVSDIEQLENLNSFLDDYPKRSIDTKELDPTVKWRNYFSGYRGEGGKNLVPFSRTGRFWRGIATGCNSYFTLTPREKDELNIPSECLIPCITRASYVKGITFSDVDFRQLVKENKKVYLFDGEKSDSPSCLSYIARGEKYGVNKRFLTEHRTPWYALEKRGVSKIWVSVFGRKGIKFIWNTSRCVNLTCFHAFYPASGASKYLDILFIYLNTNFAKELFARGKREYGNGLEKFEPNDINKSLALSLQVVSEEDFRRLEHLQEELITSPDEERESIVSRAELIFRHYYESFQVRLLD